MNWELTVAIAGQAMALLAAIIISYVKTAVRLKEIELKIEHTERQTTLNSSAIAQVQADFTRLSLKIEHIETMQQFMCDGCPFRFKSGVPSEGVGK